MKEPAGHQEIREDRNATTDIQHPARKLGDKPAEIAIKQSKKTKELGGGGGGRIEGEIREPTHRGIRQANPGSRPGRQGRASPETQQERVRR